MSEGVDPVEFPLMSGWAGFRGGAAALLVDLVTMPSIRFLGAWRKRFRHLFFILVLATAAGFAVILFARS